LFNFTLTSIEMFWEIVKILPFKFLILFGFVGIIYSPFLK
jgi:hypothetical protein